MKAVALGGWRFHAVVGVQNEKTRFDMAAQALLGY